MSSSSVSILRRSRVAFRSRWLSTSSSSSSTSSASSPPPPSKPVPSWRFRTPIAQNEVCHVVFCGNHFQYGLERTRSVLEERDLADRIRIVHAPTDHRAAAPQADVVIPFMERLDSSFIERATKCRLIIQYGVGLEGVDVDAATRRGVAVSNVPAHSSGNARATAEHALYLAASLLRYRSTWEARFRDGVLGGLPVPRSLHRKRVAVVGYGAVGSRICAYLQVMGARVTAVRKRPWNDHPPITIPSLPNGTAGTNEMRTSNDLDDVLPSTDVLILCPTLTQETFHLINEERVNLLPKGALIVNVGRGPLVSYTAVLNGLKYGGDGGGGGGGGHLGGYASDVGIGHDTKPSEPWDPTDELSQMPNVLFTPHIGGYCDTSYETMAHVIVDAILQVIEGRAPDIWVNQP